jgi:hypothetical protein
VSVLAILYKQERDIVLFKVLSEEAPEGEVKNVLHADKQAQP